MEEAIKNFPEQFAWEPAIENGENLSQYQKFVVCGMGGSAMAGDLLRMALTDIEIKTHRDYGLPGSIKNTLIVTSSYSGNTEETLESFEEALQRNLPVVAITAGGKLLELAQKQEVPYVLMPDTGIQPRMATGFSTMAHLKIMFEGKYLKEATLLSKTLDVDAAKKAGEDLAKKLTKKIPIIYSSYKDFPIACNWKIKFNETGKIPAFANYFPELNHNEMTGFDFRVATKELSQKFHFILLKDQDAGAKINKRMGVMEKMFIDMGFGVDAVAVEGKNTLHKIFQNLLIADWTACLLARHYHVDPEHVPMVEAFKKNIK